MYEGKVRPLRSGEYDELLTWYHKVLYPYILNGPLVLSTGDIIMAFTLPTFNLSANVWVNANLPNASPPDVMGVMVQLYINTRGLLDVTPNAWDTWVPPVWVRIAIAGFDDTYNIFEVPGGSAKYYRVRWRDVIHKGFPNEYGAYLCEQVINDGTPVLPPLP